MEYSMSLNRSAIAAPIPSSSWSSPIASAMALPRFGCYYKRKMAVRCFIGHSTGLRETICRKLQASFGAVVLLNAVTNQVIAAEYSQSNICQLASITENSTTLTIDNSSEDENQNLMMTGMTANNFNPIRYSGRWFEVASLKRGFAGQGQEDCHCTQGVYSFDAKNRAIQVDTFCVHGSPDGYITGIRGNVQCLNEAEIKKAETKLERQEMIREKCFLRFPTIPFIPKLPYDVIATDYDNFAIISGAKDRSFVQIYSRTPNPGPDFIENYKTYLSSFGYDPSDIKDTPQDCDVMPTSQLALMMSQPGMQQALTNQFPELGLKRAVQFDPFTSVLETFKKLIELYFNAKLMLS
ncbi:hypothetical protein SUGI_0951740 [Cryptomeria japonica]|nr:hypothetical protein SUGI_0951740 [Cryptomeria japonica]